MLAAFVFVGRGGSLNRPSVADRDISLFDCSSGRARLRRGGSAERRPTNPRRSFLGQAGDETSPSDWLTGTAFSLRVTRMLALNTNLKSTMLCRHVP
jgi:hypothetical protein